MEKSKEEIALEARRAYQRERYRKNRKKINERQRRWRAENPEKVRQYNKNYWLKKAAEIKAE